MEMEVGGALSVWRGGGGRRLNANLRKPVHGRIGTQSPETGSQVSKCNGGSGPWGVSVATITSGNIPRDPRACYETQNSTKQILETWTRCQGVTAILFCCLRLCPTGARTGVLEGVIWNQSCHSWLPRQPGGAHARVREGTVGRIINMHKLEEPGRGFNCVCRRVKLRLMEGIQNYRRRKGGKRN